MGSSQLPTIKEYPPGQWPLYHSIPLLIGQDGYVKGFDITNYSKEDVKRFYDAYGVVVFENVLTQDEISRTIDDLWTETKAKFDTQSLIVDRNDESTWEFYGMQQDFGFVGDQPINRPQIWRNRVNPTIYTCFKTLYQITTDHPLDQALISCFDRGSMMRPTKTHPQWQTSNIYHFDIDPWYWTGVSQFTGYQRFNFQYEKFNNYGRMLGEGNYLPKGGYTRLQGVLALSDTSEDSGGFEAALGFQNYIRKWCEKKDYGTRIEKDKELIKVFQKVPMKKGSLLLFTRELPHNIYPNKSDKFRYAQYLRMTPESTLMLTPQLKQKRKALIHPMIPKDLQRTNICKETLMLQE